MDFINAGQWWWLLIPLGTGIWAFGGSWLGATLARLAEHRQWKRNKKQEAYAEFVAKVKLTAHDVEVLLSPDRMDELSADDVKRMEAYMQLELVASNAVSIEANGLINDIKRFRVVVLESEGFEKRAKERLENPKAGDSDLYKDQLANAVREKSKLSHMDLALACVDQVHARMRSVVNEMREDLGMPDYDHTNDDESPLARLRDSQRQFWGNFGFGVDEDILSLFEQFNDALRKVQEKSTPESTRLAE